MYSLLIIRKQNASDNYKNKLSILYKKKYKYYTIKVSKSNLILCIKSVVVITDNYEITVELVELQRKSKIFKKDREKYNQLAKMWLEKRIYYNSLIEDLLNKAQIAKKNRDQLNKQVKVLKKDLQVIKEKLTYHQQISNEIKAEMDKIPAKNLKNLMKIRKQIKSLEWSYQTKVVDKIEEKEIVNQIEKLEKHLDENKTVIEQLNLLEQRLDEIKAIEKEIKNKQKEIIKLADESQVYHQNMVNFYSEIDNKIRPDADLAHQTYLEMKKQADENHNNLTMTIPRIKMLKKKLAQKKNDFNKLSTVVETRVEKALEKMKEGKRLTLDEFALLVKSGLL